MLIAKGYNGVQIIFAVILFFVIVIIIEIQIRKIITKIRNKKKIREQEKPNIIKEVTVKNPLTDEKFNLKNTELSKYNIIMENIDILMNSGDSSNLYIPLAPLKESRDKILTLIEWFKENNIKVYNGLFKKKCEITGLRQPIINFKINSKTIDKFDSSVQESGEFLEKTGLNKEEAKSLFTNLFSVGESENKVDLRMYDKISEEIKELEAGSNEEENNDNIEVTDYTNLKSESNWIEDGKLKVWEKDLYVSPPDNMSLIIDLKLQNVELWNYFLDKKPFNGISYFLLNPDIFELPAKKERLIEFQYEIQNGIKDGFQTVFYETNPFTIHYKIMMKNDKKNGEEIGYFKNGKIKYTLNWIDDKREGKQINYFENGKIDYENFHKNGKKDGVEKEYYENGELKKTIKFKNGERDGKFKELYENGQIRFEGNFTNNKESGVWRMYDEKGNLLTEKIVD